MINIIKTLRLHQWVKNVLIFIPFVASHQVISIAISEKLLLYFLSFSLCASACYIVNDLFDIKNDKKHFSKKYRPIASGKLSKQTGLIIAIVLLILSFFIAKNFGENNFLLILVIYFVLSFFYSAFLKRFILIDVIGLTTLYTLRIFAGSQIGNIKISFWLIVFSIFFFLSLAFLKRYNEISKKKNDTKSPGRGYYGSDKLLIKLLGVNSGYMSILVLALYLNSEIINILYKTPEYMWVAVITFLSWINWIWIKSSRNQVHHDPILFVLKDAFSILAFILILFAYVLASY